MATTLVLGKRLGLAAAVLAAILTAMTASAQFTGPCAETVTKHCGSVIPGEGRMMKCLDDHRDDQSIACKDWIAEQQKSLTALNAACFEEIAKLCRMDAPTGIRIFQCLNNDYNYVNLKLDCREKLREIKDRMQ